MWVRYPITVLLSYAVMLGLIRLWVEVEWSRFDPGGEEVSYSAIENDEPGNFSPPRGGRSWLDWIDLPHVDIFEWDEGCLPAILGVIALVLAFLFLVTIAGAPALLAEVFLDTFLAAALYRRLRIAQKEHWLGTALRKTWRSALITAVALMIGGWILEEMAPGSRSIGKAIEQIRQPRG